MIEQVTEWIGQGGYPAIAALMLLENLFPPLPSEVIMPLAGFAAARGELSVIGVVLAGSAGSLAGTLPWYFAARWFGAERLQRWTRRHGRWLALKPKEVEQARHWFGRHGRKTVAFARLLPAVRTLISVPAGLCGMGLTPFLLFSAAGILAWSAALAVAGYLLEDEYRQVAAIVDPLSKLLLAALVALYVWRVVRWKPD